MKLFTWVQTNDYIRIISVSNTWKCLTEYKQMIILELLLLVILETINCMKTNDYITIISVSNTWKYLTVRKPMIILELLVLVILETI